MREDLHTEFKREWKDEYLRNVAALANTEGGTIYIGIDDEGKVFGVERIDHLLKAIPERSRISSVSLSSWTIIPKTAKIIFRYVWNAVRTLFCTTEKCSSNQEVPHANFMMER